MLGAKILFANPLRALNADRSVAGDRSAAESLSDDGVAHLGRQSYDPVPPEALRAEFAPGTTGGGVFHDRHAAAGELDSRTRHGYSMKPDLGVTAMFSWLLANLPFFVDMLPEAETSTTCAWS